MQNDRRKLIITADDFGAALNINEGIRKAAENGSITAISALTNFTESIVDLKELSIKYPGIGIGVHLNIEAGKPVLDPSKIPSLINEEGYFYSLDSILTMISSVSLNEVRLELRAQVNILVENGIRVDHLSDHCGIISLYTPFTQIMKELAVEYDIPVRSPILASMEFPKLFRTSVMKKKGRDLVCKTFVKNPVKAIGLVKYCSKKEMRRKQQELKKVGIPHTDFLFECFWGSPSMEYLSFILNNLPAGTSEVIVHLGTETRKGLMPSGIDIEYFDKREIELEVITDPSIKGLIERENIQLIGFSDLKGSPKTGFN